MTEVMIPRPASDAGSATRLIACSAPKPSKAPPTPESRNAAAAARAIAARIEP